MSYLLDTSICAAHFRRPAGMTHRFFQYSGRLFLPTIVLGELYAGAYHVNDPAPLLDRIDDLLNDVRVLDFESTLTWVVRKSLAGCAARCFVRVFRCRVPT